MEGRRGVGGYASCPLVTGYSKTIMAEFDYEGRRVDPRRERTLNYLLKAYGVPFLYWNFMLKGVS